MSDHLASDPPASGFRLSQLEWSFYSEDQWLVSLMVAAADLDRQAAGR